MFYFLNRSNGLCGLCPEKGAAIDLFKNGRAKLTFFPKDVLVGETFEITHLPSHKVLPR